MGKIKNLLSKNKYYFRIFALFIADAFGIVLAYTIALFARFDFNARSIPYVYIGHFKSFLCMAIIVSIFFYYTLKLYHSIWRYASLSEIARVVLAYLGISFVLFILNACIYSINIPRSCLLIGVILSAVICTITRFSYRIIRNGLRDLRNINSKQIYARENIMIIGAGSAARELITELKQVRQYKVRTIIDDNKTTWGRYLQGIRIYGGRDKILEACCDLSIDRIIYAIPSASSDDRRDILNICNESGCKLQTVPGLLQIVSGEVNVTKLRDVNIEDLLERDEIKVNNEEILKAIKNQVVMVTGGGGSIGSELCRQIAAALPKQLIIFDIYENNAYQIEQELKRKYPDLSVEALIGSVRNTSRIEYVLKKYHPDVIYHAAAHKHVPLMEKSPNEAVKNNVMGTYKLANAAATYKVKRFLLISTDKAVNPTSLMGATKRICEMIIQMMARKYPSTVYSAVRFGNVLGSNGSVIPLFKQQIAEGGPVTVTDKNIVRYFMTIPEAVSLVLQAGYYANGGEIFVLNMGKPVKIDDMARNLIKLSGYKPDVDIMIEYTGLRPGEKLYEELLMNEEGMKKTANELIFIGHPIDMDDNILEEQISKLDRASNNDEEDIKKLVAEVVPTYSINH